MLRVSVLGVVVANGVLLLPYARALWWQHLYRTPPARWQIPVAGVPVESLSPSFGAPRSMGPHEGIDVAAGAQIGSVGNSGNASTTRPHLHFATYLVTSRFYPMRYHPIDPYPLLVAAPGSERGEAVPRP